MTLAASMQGLLHFLSPALTALKDEFNKGGTTCLAKNRTAKISTSFMVSAVLMNASFCVQSEEANPTPLYIFLIFFFNHPFSWLSSYGAACNDPRQATS